MIRPRYPEPVTYQPATVVPPAPTAPVPATYAPPTAPAPVYITVPAEEPARRSMAPYLAAGAGGVAAVLVVGVILTALLLAVAVTAVSLTVAFLVIRSLLNAQTHADRSRRR